MLGPVISNIVTLQKFWTKTNTAEMAERGVAVRSGLPNALDAYSAVLSAAVGITESDLLIEGRDGTGNKTAIPWARFGSASRTPSAQSGWYCVLLFHSEGKGFHLALAHGSTRLIGGSYRARSDSELAALVDWARFALRDQPEAAHLESKMHLGARSRALGAAYEKSTAFAKWYPATSLPADENLLSDLLRFARLLRCIYEAEDLDAPPGEDLPDVQQISAAIRPDLSVARRARASGQGRGLTGPERIAVELRAMQMAREKLTSLDYQVLDHSSKASYDYLASKQEEAIYVEVKGTTGQLGSILLTVNEVNHHKAHYPNNALIVVHSIKLDRTSSPPNASGGVLVMFQPWEIDDGKLNAIAFQYDGLA